MSLVTLCPACGTLFKVVRDQLRISDGWVRCGHCTEVFDSTPSLREVDLTPDAVPAALPMAVQREVLATELPYASWPGELPDALTPDSAGLVPDVAPHGVFATSVMPDIPLDTLAPPDALPEPVWTAVQAGSPIDLDLADERTFSPSQSLTESVDRMSSLLGDEAHQLNAAEPAIDKAPALDPIPGGDFSFMDPVRRKTAASAAKPARRLAQAGWLLVGLLLTLLLLAQGVVHERDRLAAVQAQWRSALEGLCGLLSCQVRPWRQIESISVDASAFNKLRGDTYRLSFVLKNSADVPLAYPAMELTLTDSQDIPLMRRVLLPAELSPKSRVLEPGAEWSGSTLVALSGDAGGVALARRVAGYRILAFYP